MRAQLTLAGERVDDLLLDTLLALGEPLILSTIRISTCNPG